MRLWCNFFELEVCSVVEDIKCRVYLEIRRLSYNRFQNRERKITSKNREHASASSKTEETKEVKVTLWDGQSWQIGVSGSVAPQILTWTTQIIKAVEVTWGASNYTLARCVIHLVWGGVHDEQIRANKATTYWRPHLVCGGVHDEQIGANKATTYRRPKILDN